MTEPTSELLMFQVGAHVYAAAVADVRKIRSVGQEGTEGLVTQSALGEPSRRHRGLVVSCGEAGERTLVVDRVLGVRAVPSSELQPIPAFAVGCLSSAAITGLALFDGAPTFLVDLPTLIGERHRAAGSSAQERHDG